VDSGFLDLQVWTYVIIIDGRHWKIEFMWKIHALLKELEDNIQREITSATKQELCSAKENIFRFETWLDGDGHHFRTVLWNWVSWTAGGMWTTDSWQRQASSTIRLSWQLPCSDCRFKITLYVCHDPKLYVMSVMRHLTQFNSDFMSKKGLRIKLSLCFINHRTMSHMVGWRHSSTYEP
jgi:hypothetical protein